MPTRLTSPVLTVDPAKMHEVDTRKAESLHGMWMVFSKCSEFMEEGRRLENLSWRLWNRETFCVAPQLKQNRTERPSRIRQDSKEVPELSSSVESAASDEADRIESHIKCPPQSLEVRPAILSEDSILGISRGKEKHVTSMDLEKMVYNIKQNNRLQPLETQQPNPTDQQTLDITPRPSSPSPTPKKSQEPQTEQQQQQQHHYVRPYQSSESCSTAEMDGNDSERPPAANSDTSVSSAGLIQTPSVVRGFSPSQISSSYRSQPRLSSTTVESTKQATQPVKPSPMKKKKGGMFTLGCSSGDEGSSFEDRNMVKPQRSSLTDGLNQSPQQQLPKKVASFKPEVESIKPTAEDEDAIETDDEISESAIEDDDDSSDWEDSVTESGRASVDNKEFDQEELFQRVDSRPNLVSRPSLLTMMMHQPQRNGGPHPGLPGGTWSRSTPALKQPRPSSPSSPNQHSTASSPDDDDDNTLTMKGPEVPRSKPIITKPIPCHSVAHSPRTTRRNMLATELTESLRRHLLMERQQKTTSATTGFKRRHTAHDMANLQEYPAPHGAESSRLQMAANNQPCRNKETSKNNSWNHYFDYGPWEYHDKGW